MNIEEHLNIPSSICQIETKWNKKHNVELWMKRDDLIHPIISGNKWRKLSGIFKANDFLNCTKIVTYGGAYSNHLIATACSCSILGTPSKGFVRGEEPKNKNSVLHLCELYGMELVFLSREEYKLGSRQQGIHEGELFIPEGGACEEGMAGCEAIIDEIERNTFTHIVVSCGTGTTIAGMAKAILKNEESAELLGVQVLKGERYIQNELKDKFKVNNATILDNYHFGGYAKTTTELDAFTQDFVKETGILLDPIYTSKMMVAIKKEIEAGKIKSGSKVLAIHTGGLTGWFGKTDNLFKV
ncbi:MAG: pyridoxal-phosphate dependent enzyme [Bacteroidia bacterium]|nr:pyridoxal-phosphate dependent enzyme [Bacteroidia bacterium]NNJ55995.1 pyridoxal-phosphate dependent enzyme [Bacteroidia bacterium]